MQLNKDLPTPLYYQIQEILEGKISSGQWQEGYQLPTEKELARQYDVSTITVKRAVHELVNRGILYRVRGKGTFVSSRVNEKDLFNLVTFGQENEKDHPHKLLHSTIEYAKGVVAKKLELKANERVFKIQRLKIDEHEPAALEYSYLVYDLCPGFSPSLIEDRLIYNVIEDVCGVRLEKAKIYFSTTVADAYEAEILNVEKGMPLIVLERTTYLAENRPVEYSKFVVRQDKADYFFEVHLA
jgi:GntR family transcriptional regulator